MGVYFRAKAFVTIVILASLSIIATMVPLSAQVLLRIPTREDQKIDCVSNNGSFQISLLSFARAFEYRCRWDTIGGSLAIRSPGGTLNFVSGNSFYSCSTLAGRFVGQLIDKPERRNGALFLPVSSVVDPFAMLGGKKIRWSLSSTAFEVEPFESLSVSSPPPLLPNTLPRQESSDSPQSVPSTPIHAAKTGRETISAVVIDPGHGGQDPGAIGPGGTKEKDVVLKIGLALRDVLRRKTGLQIYMTRDCDVFIPLQERTRFANQKKADLFVSIHANSISGSKAKRDETRGYKIYFLSQAKNEEDKLAAMRENAVVELEHSPKDVAALQSIITEILNNEYLHESQEFSIQIDQAFGKTLNKIGKLHLGIGQAPFWVLNGAYMPAVLVETGFISNPEEENQLNSPATHQKMAEGITAAIISFKKKIEGP